jgi:hypothetical protein
METIYIASIDPGKCNFAFSIEEIDIKKARNIKNISEIHKIGKTIIAENIDVSKNLDKTKYLDTKIFVNLTNTLDKYREYWDKCSIILIELQMSFGRNKNNIMGIKVAQHCFSYFTFLYSDFKKIIEYPAYHKTQVLEAPKKMDKPTRKKWSVAKVLDIQTERGDRDFLTKFEKLRKRDDISDCVLMNLTFAYQHYKLRKIF